MNYSLVQMNYSLHSTKVHNSKLLCHFTPLREIVPLTTGSVEGRKFSIHASTLVLGPMLDKTKDDLEFSIKEEVP